MNWRVAKSLEKLLAQVNAAHPGRSKASDGAIGDQAHAASKSDHNPDVLGIVRARDFTHDPPRLDAPALAEQLRRGRDPRIKYVISNRRIFAGPLGPSPWVWRPYGGSDPHTSHAHVSVISSAAGDDARAWTLTAFATPPKPKPVITPRKAPTMYLIKGDASSSVYITNGLTKRHVGPGEVADLLRMTGQPSYLTIAQSTCNRIPDHIPGR